MFVLEALVLTFMTSPMIIKLYPPKYRKRAAAIGTNFDGVEESAPEKAGDLTSSTAAEQDSWKTRFTVVLDKMEHLPSIMTVAQLFRPFAPHDTHRSGGSGDSRASSSSAMSSAQLPIIDALRLIELSDRTSAVMKSSVADSLIHTDPLLNVFRTFSELNDVPVSASLSVVPFDGRAARVVEHAKENHSQLILLPWLPHTVPITHPPGLHSVGEHYPHTPVTPSGGGTSGTNPFDILFNFGIAEQSSSVVHSHFVRGIFAQSSVDVALYVDRGRVGGPAAHYGKQHIVFPFFGGPDDRLALSMVVQLCGNSRTTATVFRVVKPELVVKQPEALELVHTTDREKHGEALAAALRDNELGLNSVRCSTGHRFHG
jgi:K+:H+ antiporter